MAASRQRSKHVTLIDTVISPATLSSTIYTDTGITPSVASGERSRDNTPQIIGTAEAGSTVRIYEGASQLGTATLSGTLWSFTTAALGDGRIDGSPAVGGRPTRVCPQAEQATTTALAAA